jgi:hypothetical protein
MFTDFDPEADRRALKLLAAIVATMLIGLLLSSLTS